MSAFNVGGDEIKSVFCRLVRCYSRRFGKRFSELFDSEFDIRSFLKETYIDWMLESPVREGLPIEAKFPLEIAKDKTPIPQVKHDCDPEALEKLRRDMIRAIDDVVRMSDDMCRTDMNNDAARKKTTVVLKETSCDGRCTWTDDAPPHLCKVESLALRLVERFHELCESRCLNI